jgi:type II secretory pathway pseudopilin PulG
MILNFLFKKVAKAFTAIEALITVLIFSLAAGVITGFIFLSYRTHNYAFEESVAINEARRGIELMAKDIRAAKTGDNGAYPIERADDKQFIFYSDIDKDGKTERVRYFIGTVTSGVQTKECTTAARGGSCSVTFSNFLTGEPESAIATVSVEGDLEAADEYVGISADGSTLITDLCRVSCLHCSGIWEGTTTFDVTGLTDDNSIQFTAQGTNRVHRECPVGFPNHSMRARVELSWVEEVIGLGNELKKGVIEPVGNPATYPADQEEISIITSYVRNDPPIFKYFDKDGNEITSAPFRLTDTRLMKIYLVVNVDPNRPPNEFELESYVQLRNLKTE